jgi:hypothetical protein
MIDAIYLLNYTGSSCRLKISADKGFRKQITAQHIIYSINFFFYFFLI